MDPEAAAMDPQQRWLLETSYRALENGMSPHSSQPAVTSNPNPLLTPSSWYSPGESSRNQYSGLCFIDLGRLHHDDCQRPRSCAADGIHRHQPEHPGEPAQLVLRSERSQHICQHGLFIQYDHHGSGVPEPEERAELDGMWSRVEGLVQQRGGTLTPSSPPRPW